MWIESDCGLYGNLASKQAESPLILAKCYKKTVTKEPFQAY